MHIPDNLYSQIVRLMPIPCVDLIVEDEEGRILLVKRANEPAKGQWWFPGGRIHFLETRVQAAARKLKEECGIEAYEIREMGSYDVILDVPDESRKSHGITTLFHVRVKKQKYVILDSQGIASGWRKPDEWLDEDLHIFIRQGIFLHHQ